MERNESLFTLSTTHKNITSLFNQVHLSSTEITLIIIYTLIFVIGIFGNVLVIVYYAFKSTFCRLYHIYLIYLAIADILCVTIVPIHYVYEILSNNVWHFSENLCIFVNVVGPLTVNISVWTLVCIAHERYRGIYRPLKERLSRVQIHLTVAFTWFASILVQIPYMNSIEIDEDKRCKPEWSTPILGLFSAIVTLFIQSIIPIVYMIYTVKKIMYTLQNRMPLSTSEGSCSRNMSQYSRKTSSRSCGTSFVTEDQQQKPNTAFNKRGLSNTSLEVKAHNLQNSACSSHVRKSLSVQELHLPLKNMPLVERESLNDQNKGEPNKTLPRFWMSKKCSQKKSLLTPKSCNTSKSVESKQSFLQKQHSMPVMQTSLLNKTDHCNTRQFPRQNSTPISITAGTKAKTAASTASTAKREFSLRMIRIRVSSSTFSLPNKLSIYRKFRSTHTSQQCDNNKKSIAYKRQILLLIVTFIAFLVCTLPYNLFYVAATVIYDIEKMIDQLETLLNLHKWLSAFVVTNSIMNCFIYAGMDGYFRSYCMSLFTCSSRSKKKNNTRRS